MSGSLDIVYRYRQLLAKCESPEGLTLDEIEALAAYEDLLPSAASVELPAHIRGRKFVDPVTLEALSRGGAICVNCPFFAEGDIVELRVPLEDSSYRFAARVMWVRELDDDSYEAGLSFEGAPVLVRNTREFPALALAAFAAA